MMHSAAAGVFRCRSRRRRRVRANLGSALLIAFKIRGRAEHQMKPEVLLIDLSSLYWTSVHAVPKEASVNV